MPDSTHPPADITSELRRVFDRFADDHADLDPKELAERFRYAAHLIALDATDDE